MIVKSLSEIELLSEGSGLLDKYNNINISGVSTDTRTITSGSLFVPLVGENFDGHKFLEKAIENGAVATLWQEDIEIPKIDFPFILVNDTLEGLQILSKNYRNTLKNIKIIGITGSNGKTSTKDILEGILSTKYNTKKTMGNYNNHIGVPLTLLSLDDDTEISIVEMGTDNFGQISVLTNIASPDYGIITNVGPSHLEDLKTKENVAIAKLEILEGLNSDGTFIYNGDDEILSNAVNALDNYSSLEFLKFGQNIDNDIIVKLIDENIDGIKFSITIDNVTEEYSLPMIGRHNIYNASGAIGIAKKIGLEYKDIQKGLLQIEKTKMRNDIIEKDNYTIINDAYNSNPKSLYAALDTMKSIDGYDSKFIVIGDMLGLGEDTEKYHIEIGEIINPDDIDKIFTFGEFSKILGERAKKNFDEENIIHGESKEALADIILENIKDKTLILVKASRGIAMEDLINKLI